MTDSLVNEIGKIVSIVAGRAPKFLMRTICNTKKYH